MNNDISFSDLTAPTLGTTALMSRLPWHCSRSIYCILHVLPQKHGGRPNRGLHGWFGSRCRHLFRQPSVQSNEAFEWAECWEWAAFDWSTLHVKITSQVRGTQTHTHLCRHLWTNVLTVKHDCLFTNGHMGSLLIDGKKPFTFVNHMFCFCLLLLARAAFVEVGVLLETTSSET